MSFNVVIDSNNALNTTSIYDKEYAFDWSVLEKDCKYKLTFTFKSTPIPDEVANVEAVALLGLGTQEKVYQAGNTTNANTSNVIGLLHRSVFTDTQARQVFTHIHDNPSIDLDYTPRNNIFRVQLQNTNNAVSTTGLTNANYILILHFNKVKDGDRTY